ncbi:MAG: FG-GAP repeat protein [Polyangiaceae bacterium]|nr:FG-GAP repeat protein [Polyangiaceae bacterium]
MNRFLYIRMVLALAITLGIAAAAVAQCALFTFRGESPERRLGRSVSGVGDVDRDGHADILVGIPGTAVTTTFAGEAQVISGRTGVVLCTLQGEKPGDQFGWSVAGVGDLNGDGYPDIAVGAPGRQGRTSGSGYVKVFSGRCAEVLFTFQGGIAGDLFGWSLAGTGDVNADDCPDIMVGALLGGANKAGTATVFSGRDGRVLHTFTGVSSYDYFGWAVALAGDTDADGWCDILVGAKEYAWLYSGRSGQLVRSFAPSPGPGMGVAVCGLGDVDADGHADYAVGFAHEPHLGSGCVELVSGKFAQVFATFNGDSASCGQCLSAVGDIDGDRACDIVAGDPTDDSRGPAAGGASLWSGKQAVGLQVCHGTAAGDRLGSSIAGLGDVNGDGCPDFAVGATQTGACGTGYVRVYSGKPLTLTAEAHTISLRTGGGQILNLDARNEKQGGPLALTPYVVLGSLSGTEPGLRVGSFTLPLNPDPYFAFTVNHPNTPLLSHTVGVLDHEGRATAAVTLPAGLPGAAAGTTLHHAFVVVDKGVELVSNAVPLTLVP